MEFLLHRMAFQQIAQKLRLFDGIRILQRFTSKDLASELHKLLQLRLRLLQIKLRCQLVRFDLIFMQRIQYISSLHFLPCGILNALHGACRLILNPAYFLIRTHHAACFDDNVDFAYGSPNQPDCQNENQKTDEYRNERIRPRLHNLAAVSNFSHFPNDCSHNLSYLLPCVVLTIGSMSIYPSCSPTNSN
ncbi:hypothetical protein D3C77_437860 [compost metagenome]